MKRAIVFAATLIVSPVVVPLCMAQGNAAAVGEEDAHAIGVAPTSTSTRLSRWT